MIFQTVLVVFWINDILSSVEHKTLWFLDDQLGTLCKSNIIKDGNMVDGAIMSFFLGLDTCGIPLHSAGPITFTNA